MNRKLVLALALTLLVGMLSVAFNVQRAKASGTVYIRADGSIDPPDAPISTVDNVTYTLTGNITSDADGIVIERDNIVVDGIGYTVHGAGSGNGADLTSRSNITIKNTTIKTFGYGIWLYGSSNNNSVVGNNVTNNDYSGICLSGSSNNNSVVGNNVTANGDYGISLSWFSTDNSVHGNNVTNNWKGIYLDYCSNNTFRTNHMSSNGLNFGVFGVALSDFIHDIDASNTVDGKLIYYSVNRQNEIVPLDAGYVALINSTNVTALNLNLRNNHEGILLAYTNNSLITGNIITNNDRGMKLVYSFNNTISGNSIDNNYDRGIRFDGSSYNTVTNNTVKNSGGSGVWLEDSSNNNMVLGNNITNNAYGIYVASSSSNTICKNNIVNNIPYGIYIHYSSNNVVCHNNFINNAVQVYSAGSVNVWDNPYPSGGNYWSNYTGVDADNDGIGDEPHTIDANNIDNYPLMGMFSEFCATLEQGVQIFCNSSISDFQSNGTSISFNVTGEDGTVGFCRICIPTALMNATYRVFVNGTEIQCNLLPCSNSSYSYLYFTYSHSTEQIIIVPEFPSFITLSLFMILSMLALTFANRRFRRKPER